MTACRFALLTWALLLPTFGWADDTLFRRHVGPLLEARCLSCHGDRAPKAGLSLVDARRALAGGDNGPVILPGKPDQSKLVQMIAGARPKMPRGGPPLSEGEVALVKKWIEKGARWPEKLVLRPATPQGGLWWSLRPLQRPAIPAVRGSASHPIDAFLLHSLEKQGLTPVPEADRRTLIRRLYFDLIGLPPSPEAVQAFVEDARPEAFERLVDRLLASPQYGERWARHWLDVAHYGDTHGFDKDKLRPNAWPYRDYVIRAFNEDRPYSRFVREQLAGDVLWPDSRDGIVATGFLAAGPWDFVGHVELREGTLDKKITRNLDRDDMVATVMNTFVSLTVQCARCHDHKFDPIGQKEYYRLQAVFSAIDRADRPHDPDPESARKRKALAESLKKLESDRQTLLLRARGQAGPEMKKLEQQMAALENQARGPTRPEFGYHSAIAPRADVVKWVQIDLGRATPIEFIVYVGCHDPFNNIGAGFGFPPRFKIEISDDPSFRKATLVEDQTGADVPNPGVMPRAVRVGGQSARYVRITATRLAPRAGDFIFALAEVAVLTPKGVNAARGATVTAQDSIEAPVRWRRSNLVDGYYHRVGQLDHLPELAKLLHRHQELEDRALPAELRRALARLAEREKELQSSLASLPGPALVYAAATHFTPIGAFTPTRGIPRPVYVLQRGNEKFPQEEVGPGTLECLPDLPGDLKLPAKHSEGQRRAALASWIVDPRNPLTWRSIVNRVWHYHFGVGLVDTPNDFGKMGGRPSHPELLDWLAVEFRDGGQSLKRLHRLIVTSQAYRRASSYDAQNARLDAGNRLLWRMNRRRLSAEEVRDSVLAVAGKLSGRMYGRGFWAFGFQDDHSPRYRYEEHDPDDPASHRRSIYRFLVRSVPDPFLEVLDCADPSQVVEKRNETLTALQALALLNNKFMVRMAEHFAARIQRQSESLEGRLQAAYRLALGRLPARDELDLLAEYAHKHGLANACRLILNLNEFAFVD